EDHASFEFAQFKIYEDLGRFDEAFAALARGNAVMYERMRHDIAGEHRLFDALMAAMPAASTADSASGIEGPLPIFIVGLPRSGTTLLDRILDNHSMVISSGERSDLPRQLRWVADCHGHELIDARLVERLAGLDYAELGRRYLAQTQWRAQGKAFF